MSIKLWPVERLLYALVTEHHGLVPDRDPDHITPTDEELRDRCRVCGHSRSQHPGGYPHHPGGHCLSSVPSEVGSYWRDPCPCTEWVDPEGGQR